MKTWKWCWFIGTILLATQAHASRNVGVRIDGTDSLCSGYTVSTDSGSSVFTCISGPVPPGAPTNCTATVNGAVTANFPSSGGTAALSVACTQTSGVLYNWSRNGTFGANSNQSWNDALPSNGGGSAINYAYSVRGCIGAACVTVPANPLVATVAASGSFSGSCPGFSQTNVITLNWAVPGRSYSSSFGPTDMVLVQFTTGNVGTTGFNLPRIAGAEWQGPPTSRTATLSTTPCAFGGSAVLATVAGSTSITFPFAIAPGDAGGYAPVLQKNTTYYINIKNDLYSCVTNCPMFLELSRPGGL